MFNSSIDDWRELELPVSRRLNQETETCGNYSERIAGKGLQGCRRLVEWTPVASERRQRWRRCDEFPAYMDR
jgi:hypothetical protein